MDISPFMDKAKRGRMGNSENFTVDGFAGNIAEAGPALVVINWNEGARSRELYLETDSQTTSNLVLASLGTELSAQALRAMGFKKSL